MLDLYSLIKFNEKGLIPAVAQDYKTGEVLMMAFMNKESIELTLAKKQVHYYSRSRHKIWKKGETSGQIQELQEMLLDCDGDAVLLKVKQTGVACHTGRKNCFFYSVTADKKLRINQEIVIPANQLYKKDVKETR